MGYSVKDRIILITGASAGIGEATARTFAEAGGKLILTARRKEKLEKLANELKEQFGTPSYTASLDVRDNAAVENFVRTLPDAWSAIDILVNNAGLGRGLDKLHEGKIADWEEMIDTNVKGLLYVSRAVIPGMVARGRGHIFNLGSIAGHETYPGGNVYCATKHAARAINNGMRIDLVDTPVRVTTIDPGLVETEFSVVRFRGDAQRAKKPYEGIAPLRGEDIADLILFAATRPTHVNINEMIVMPKAQATSTLVHRKV
ncbi:SDR family oxidoreductase [bacterium]|nr:SDR family oxidoreductase [bacterium]NUN46067.1 SDR family oxidoreductase [bacterium]